MNSIKMRCTGINLIKICKTYTLKTINHCWGKLNTQIIRDLLVCRLRFNMATMSDLPVLIYRVATTLIRILAYVFEIKKLVLKFIMRSKRLKVTKQLCKKKKNRIRTRLPHFKSYIATVINSMCYWHKDRQTDQWNRIQSLEINPHIYG